MITYKDTGVDVKETDAFTHTLGMFDSAAVRGLKHLCQFERPTIVMSCDGVGTKTRLALLFDQCYNLGYDLVGMVINDLLTKGALPYYFMDYIGMNTFNDMQAVEIVSGIKSALKSVDCELVGGETAVMPETYQYSNMDISGFGIGFAESVQVADLSGTRIESGDLLYAVHSHGLHSNGFSLINELWKKELMDYMWADMTPEAQEKFVTQMYEFLTPTRIYYNEVLELLVTLDSTVKGLAHITGGGLHQNIEKITGKPVYFDSAVPMEDHIGMYQSIVGKSSSNFRELSRVFNMGYGMVAIVSKTAPTPPDAWRYCGYVK